RRYRVAVRRDDGERDLAARYQLHSPRHRRRRGRDRGRDARAPHHVSSPDDQIDVAVLRGVDDGWTELAGRLREEERQAGKDRVGTTRPRVDRVTGEDRERRASN